MKFGDIRFVYEYYDSFYLVAALIPVWAGCRLVRWYQSARQPPTVLRDETINPGILSSKECHPEQEAFLGRSSHCQRVRTHRTDIMRILSSLCLGLCGLYSCVAAFSDDYTHHLRRQFTAGNSSGVLVDFEVYKPVEFDPASQACNEVILLMEHEFAYSYGEPFVGNYTPPDCDFDTVRINFTVTSRGRQYDRLALMYLNSTEVFRTSTAEPTTDGIVWTYIKEMSQYRSLWKSPQKIIFDLGNLIDSTYTGTFNTALTASFTKENSGRVADVIYPISALQGAENAASAFTVPSDNATVDLIFPSNAQRAVVSISACGQSDEEFWWSAVLNQDTNDFDSTIGELYGYSPFREVQLFIDGMLAGVVWPFPVIFTGGVAPGLWRPIVGIDAFDLREPEIDISPFIPLLLDGKAHSFEIKVAGLDTPSNGTATLVETVNSYWVVTGKVFIYLNESGKSNITSIGTAPTISAPDPQFSFTRSLVTNSSGVNETLSYSVQAHRTLKITSGQSSWTQDLSYSNDGYLNQDGLSQWNLQNTTGTSSTAGIGLDGTWEEYQTSFSYPIEANTTYGIGSDYLTIDAIVDRGLSISSTGGLGISTYTLTSGAVDLQTRQWGTATYLGITGGSSYSSGDTSDEFAEISDGTSYSTYVHAINGTVVTPGNDSHSLSSAAQQGLSDKISLSQTHIHSLAQSIHTLIQSQSEINDERPRKRRKVEQDVFKSPIRVETGDGDFVVLCRVTINLIYPGENLPDSPETGCELPVLLKYRHQKQNSLSSDNGQPSREPTCDKAGDEHWLELRTINRKQSLSFPLLGAADVEEIVSHLSLATCATPLDTTTGDLPYFAYRARLVSYGDSQSFRLVADVQWKNSLVIPSNFKGKPEAGLAFARYTPAAEGFHHNITNGSNNGRLAQSHWTPRDFYDNVHVPLVTPEASAKIDCPLTKCTLYPFQTRALRWLLEKEGVEVDSEGDVVSRRIENKFLPESFKEFIDVEGRRCFASQLYKVATTDLSQWSDSIRSLRGGILAEEMGLGKTVEMISLICLHQCVMSIDENIDENHGLTKSRATLIITPPAILEQWRQELQKHAPALSIFDYTGLESYSKMSQEDILRTLSETDVVLTTYNVLSREVYRAVDPPRRNMRHAKRFITPKSPLVRISWWRVCLDEAQMIENGVSNAAQVARLVPRINAWAVTGTPIRKDMKDLFGLLQFLKYEPFCNSVELWTRLFRDFYPAFKSTINRLALRHSKDFIRKDLNLPLQKRVVITTPFTAVEEQNYSQLFEQMCDECGVDYTGNPLTADWDPESRSSIDKMRHWLTRLRQSCLHPEVAPWNRKALGIRGGPLRSVDEVLAVMIDQNENLTRAEERLLLLSRARRGQLLENALHRHEALELWQKCLERATEMVKDCREELRAEQTTTGPNVANSEISDSDSEKDETDESGKNGRVGTIRLRLRAALEVQHICKFFTANAYYQIKTDPKLTAPDSEEFKALGKSEEAAYDEAKLMRKEMLKDVTRKARKYIKTINEKAQTKSFVRIPMMNAKLPTLGIEARRLFERLEDFCDALNQHRDKYIALRDDMVKLLRKSLVDEEENGELEGNEYETSTKHQDEMYVYMEGLRVMFADRHDALTGQKNSLIDHEAKVGVAEAEKGNGPSPELYLAMMKARDEVKPKLELGSLRGIASDMRSLVTSLEWQANEGSSRARAELVIANEALARVGKISSEQGKAIRDLEREVELFRDTMNQRLEYYRQLQQISDTVAPYDEASVGKPLNQEVYQSKLEAEKKIEDKLSALQSKGKYLLHLRDESGPDESTRICVICQSPFENGVLTICGHKYCKSCLRAWWSQHRTCPMCKRKLKSGDFHQITYKPQELIVREERTPTKLEYGRPSQNGIYSDISSGVLQEIKNIDLSVSFGTKVDTLSRHLLWLRDNDPGAKSIVFSQYSGFLNVLSTAFSRCGIGYSSVESKNGIQRFKEDPAVECFLLHARAHSSGLNLVNASHVFLCEPLINTAIELQAIARVHRIGQHRPTTVWMYLVSDTVEESIYQISVSRRLSHVVQKEKEKKEEERHSPFQNGKIAGEENLHETAIESANSLEIQQANLGKLLATGSAGGGELVGKDDLWQCLFGNGQKRTSPEQNPGALREVDRFLRGEAAEKRKQDAIDL
ncbi:hypothetical protein UA08_00027 [Talaromyces atroroseus]|uniref:Uncharacterized protein n=1 Tax=Talaromyces atroroseus TaxID=1441469 RepID=A0A225ARW9_TALAT|nr:hypothetical protein UA08_00027 [Talaromyces atroroseus]OKL64331.1 hypothetical protein UA08_00027 [Talaromyces atroroseus]